MEEYNIKSKVVGVDISNESTTYAIVDLRGNILAEDSFSTQDYPDVNNFVTALSEKIVTLVESNGGYETIRSIGVSCLWQRCCATVWDWQWPYPTMHISQPLANTLLAVLMV